jgi:hypothetical protein
MLPFLAFVLLNFLGLYIGGRFTGPGVTSSWYQTLDQAPWTPPGWVFGVAWTTVMIGFSWFMAWIQHWMRQNAASDATDADEDNLLPPTSYVVNVKGQGIQISMDGKGRAIDNVIVERFFRTIKYDKLYLESLETGADVQRACHEFIQYYNHKRDHSSIGNQPPMVFYKLAA